MATGILWMEGFDTLAAPGSSLVDSRYTPFNIGGWTWGGTSLGRFGGYGMGAVTDHGLWIDPACGLADGAGTTWDHLLIQFGWRWYTGNGMATIMTHGFYDGPANVQVHFRVDNVTGIWTAYRGSGTSNLLGSATAIANVTAWHFMEFRVKFHGSTGEVEIRCDGVPILTLTGQDTTATVNAYADRAAICNGVYDDLLLIDYGTSGGYLGDHRVRAYMPSSDNSVQWTPSAGSNYNCVNEAAPTNPSPDNTDYVRSSTAGHLDLYGLPDTSGSPTITAVQVITRISKDEALTRTMRNVLKLSGTTVTGATKTLTPSWVTNQFIRSDKPGGTGWTSSDLDSLLAGIEVVA